MAQLGHSSLISEPCTELLFNMAGLWKGRKEGQKEKGGRQGSLALLGNSSWTEGKLDFMPLSLCP